MSAQPDPAIWSARDSISGCWNRIGVRGDSSCVELVQHVHCRNCPVYSAAALDLLDGELPAGYLGHWTSEVSRPRQLDELDTHSVVVFRIGAEWLALPAELLQEIVSLRTIHSLPHRRSGVVLGVANIRGELLVCFSLQQLLGLEQTANSAPDKQRMVAARLLVIRHEGSHVACPVDEVLGLARFRPGELAPVPATIARSTATYTRSILHWQERAVGVLDEQLLLHTVNRSLA